MKFMFFFFLPPLFSLFLSLAAQLLLAHLCTLIQGRWSE